MALGLSSCTPLKGLWYNKPDPDDYAHVFKNNTASHSGPVHPLVSGYEKPLPPIETWATGPSYQPGMDAQSFLEKTGTLALVILHEDTLVYEQYFDGYADTSLVTTFSAVKSIMTILVGCAIRDGHIQSVDQQVRAFIPEFDTEELYGITIRDLLYMKSGLRFREPFVNVFAKLTRLYYGPEMRRLLSPIHAQYPAGDRYEYRNINTQLLGYILVKATGKSVSGYLEECLWAPMGMESDALWSTDNTGMERTFCCLNARARDFARLGLLMLRKGNWYGKQLVPQEWIQTSLECDTGGSKPVPFYRMNWRSLPEKQYFWAEGLLGQYIFIAPETRTVIVRFGRKVDFRGWAQLLPRLAGAEKKPVPVSMSSAQLSQFAGEYTFLRSTFKMQGMKDKTATIRIKGKGLSVRYPGKDFTVFPVNDSTFYSEEFHRTLIFHDETSTADSLEWNRYGVTWILSREP